MNISAQDVKKLREMTGAGMMDCKEALAASSGQFEEAVDFLRKKGLAKAAKKAGRDTREGLVEAFVDPAGARGAMIEMNCETDFVARTADFRSLIDGLVRQAHQTGPRFLNREAAGPEAPAGEIFLEQQFPPAGSTVEEAIQSLIGRLGENMQLSRFVHYAPENGGVHAYIHPGNRVGVLLEAECPAGEYPRHLALAHDLAMQVAAAAPRFVVPEEVDEATLNREREIFREQLKDTNKPPQVIEKIVEGKLSKFYEEVCLMEQPFIKDPDHAKKVKEVVAESLKQNGGSFRVTRFARFALGEGM